MKEHILVRLSGICSKKGGKKGAKKGKTGVEWVSKDYRESPDLDVICSPQTGLMCLNYMQPDSLCEDYRIRVLCACGEYTICVTALIHHVKI